ncbi:unnamed protein product [Effrenium voratum]|uniref:Uncharacterized protein n=1 Tax=Effrenium voratum TaxID=2562239 RepID=A0AA36IBM4_9DINO|nr:unnamed protein product [Effrenium voratum]
MPAVMQHCEAKDSHTLALQAFREQPEGAAAHEGEADSSAKRPRYSQPAPMHMGFTSGSVDGVIGRMAEPQNVSRAAAFLAEGLIFLSWISDRTTVLVDAPCIGVCAAVHMEELMAALGEEDPLGLRERLLVMYEHPRFVRSAQLREACSRIPGDTLHGFLAKGLWELHARHHPGHESEQFAKDLNYSWLYYTWSEEAAALFWGNFDDKASEQEASYKLDQQAAKKAGKGKTRHYWLALPLHNLMQKCANVTAADWCTVIPVAAAQASVIFSQYMDDVFAHLDLLRLPAPDAAPVASASPSAPAVPVRPRTTHKQNLRSLLATTSVPSLLTEARLEPLVTMCHAVCVSQRLPCMRISDVGHLRPVLCLQLPTVDVNLHAPRALTLLHLLGLGALSLSTNATGAKTLWFVKRPREAVGHEALRDSLQLFEAAESFHTLPERELQTHRKQSQAEIVFSNLDDPAIRQSIAAATVELRAALAARG